MQNAKRFCALFAKRFITNQIPYNRSLFTISSKLYQSTVHNNTLFATNTFYNQRTLLSLRLYHDDTFSDAEEDFDTIYQDPPRTVKNDLYPDHDDPLIPILNNSASIQEVFNFLRKYDKIIQPIHLAQAVLVLWDLQRIFQHVTEMTSIDKVEQLMKDYSSQLLNRHEFRTLLEFIEKNVDQYNAIELSCIHMYLNKIGVSKDENVMKMVFAKSTELISASDGLPALSRFMISVTYNKDQKGYELCKQLLPSILQELDTCKNATDLKLISICLNVLNKEITTEMLTSYKNKLNDMLEQNLVNPEDTDVLIKIILFLNYPQWRHKHSELLSKCILLLKNKLNQLSLNEILVLNNVFLKTQEPASILFDLQRCTSKLLRELEENESTAYNKRLRLVTFLIQLAAPTQRLVSETLIRKYFLYPLNGISLLELLQAINYTKLMDPVLCKQFWDKILTELEHDEDFKNNNLLKVCYSYLNYNSCLPYRHVKLEKRLNQWIEGLIETSRLLEQPKQFIGAAAFVIAYGNDVSIMNYMTNIFRDNWKMFGSLECTTIARALHIGRHTTKNIYLKDRYHSIFCNTMDMILNNVLDQDQKQEVKQAVDINILNLMMKTYIYRNKLEHPIVNKILLTYKNDTYLSSKQIKKLTVSLMYSSALIPGIIESMVDYVCKCKESIYAFNAEKVAFLCYYLGYIPSKSEIFSKVLVDLILRDQEKINGLSYLQSCLSLCFFNNMTGPLIKQIFNVTFMEKLDVELRNCYAKDVYPNRVHARLMELNRTVCIDYPQLNIPWFHQKYVQQTKHAGLSDPNFVSNVENYLNKIFYDCDIETNASTPYGYNVDFTIMYKDDNNNMIKLGILLTKPKHYTNINRQLKGAMQTKIRHVEMLGYKVKVISYNDWNALVYAEDKITYIRNLLHLPSRYPRFYYQINR